MIWKWCIELCSSRSSSKSTPISSSDDMNDISNNHIVDEVLWTTDPDYYYDPYSHMWYKSTSS